MLGSVFVLLVAASAGVATVAAAVGTRLVKMARREVLS